MVNIKLLQIPGFKTELMREEATRIPIIYFESAKGDFRTALKRSQIQFGDESFINKNAERIKTLIFNRIAFEDKVYANPSELEDFLIRNYPILSPQEKLDRLLEKIGKMSSYDGEEIEFSLQHVDAEEVWRSLYFKNMKEFEFYLENLKDQGLIEYDETKDSIYGMRLTIHGLTRLTELEAQNNSRYCFIAMSFDEEDRRIFDEAIMPALSETNFLACIVSDMFIDSERTINDEIIAGIKKSKFTIADFTKHKRGVYFEAGYALGRGQKVIYTCRNDHMGDAHFDTRNFQHIVWTDAEDLKSKLIARIEATIIE